MKPVNGRVFLDLSKFLYNGYTEFELKQTLETYNKNAEADGA